MSPLDSAYVCICLYSPIVNFSDPSKTAESGKVPATEGEKDAMIRSLLSQIEELQNGDNPRKKERRRSSRKDKQVHNSNRDNCAVHGRKNRVQFEQPPPPPQPQFLHPPQPQLVSNCNDNFSVQHKIPADRCKSRSA